MLPNGMSRGLGVKELRGEEPPPEHSKLYTPDNILSQGVASADQAFTYQDKTYSPGQNAHWKAQFPKGMERLAVAGRLHVAKNSLRYVRSAEDFAWKARNNIWTDTLTGQFTEDKFYVVQTNTKVVERCLLMTTDPGNLVLDPTCGSGTTAYVAEQWGRRWITIDTSRVSVALARQRLLTATFPFYSVKEEEITINNSGKAANPGRGFDYKKVPHITLKSIAQNVALDAIFAKHQPILDETLDALNAALKTATSDLRQRLAAKLREKERREGKKAITDADRRRWLLPKEDWKE
jgi:adenine-specific DNA-methyltransferase